MDIVDVEKEDYKIEHSINDFIIISFKVTLYTNMHKIIHKNKFYKSLYDDIMEVAWNPDRFMNWCLDFEDLRNLKERWRKN